MLGENLGKIKNSRKGFTLIEMLVVVFVLSIGIIGALSFFNINLNNQFEAKNELVAAGLAQEETDIIRNVVDYNFLNPPNKWYQNIATDNKPPKKIKKKTKYTDGLCEAVDYESLTNHTKKHQCDHEGMVCLNANQQYYQCNDLAKALFSRTVTIYGIDMNNIAGIDLDHGDCLQVEATVGWPVVSGTCDDSNFNCDRITTSNDIICEPRQ
jgi:prepilin-type N-terminal cleavage/methylation domain-containing protein